MADDLVTRRIDQLGEVAELETGDLMMVQRGDGPAQAAPVEAMMTYMEENGVGSANAAAAAGSAAAAAGSAGQAADERAAAEEARVAAEAAAEDAQGKAGEHTIDFAGGVAEGRPIFGLVGATNNIPNRWNWNVDGTGYLNVTHFQAAYCVNGWRSLAARKPGRALTVLYVMPTTGFVANQTGPAIGFDPGKATGADATASASARYAVIRAGTVVWETAGGASDATLTVAKEPNSATAQNPAAGEVFMVTLAELADGTGKLTIVRGGTTTTYLTGPLPAGAWAFGVRAIGSGTTGGANPVSQIRSASWADATITQNNVSQVNISMLMASTSLTPGFARSQPVSPVRDANAFLRRTTPPGFPYLPIKPTLVYGPGDVVCDRNSLQAYLALHPEVAAGPIAYVNTITGSNATGALNDENRPFATTQHALQNTAARIIVLAGDDEFPDHRFTHANGGVAKIIIAKHFGLSKFRVAGDDLSAKAWTAVDGSTKRFKTILTSTNIGGDLVSRVLRKNVRDSWGFDARMTQYMSEAALEAAGTGWYVNVATKELQIADGGASIEATKANFRALYVKSNGSFRAFVYGASLGMFGINFEGGQIDALEYNNGGAWIAPEVYIGFCTMFCGGPAGYALSQTQGGVMIADNLRIHASTADGFNPTWSTNTGTGLMMIIGCHITESGDEATFSYRYSLDPTGLGFRNKQAGSAHSGFLVVIATLMEANYGQQWADVQTVLGVWNKTWGVGVICRGAKVATDCGYFLGGPGAVGQVRETWLDTCWFGDTGNASIVINGTGARLHLFNVVTELPHTYEAGALASQITAYSPANP